MKSRIPLLLFALLGLGASLTAGYVHYNLLVNPSYTSFCDVNATVSCTQAYLSPYGSLFGVPVALAGVFFFAVIVGITALSGRKTPRVGSMATSPAALAVAALFAIGGVTLLAAFPNEQAAQQQAAKAPAEFPPLSDQQRADLEKWWDVQPKVNMPVPNDGMKVLMVKFNDYQCPACGQTYRAYAGLIEKWTKTGQFKFVTKHYPLDSKCNPGNTLHPAACEAAAAVTMARRKGDGSAEKLEDWYFNHQGPPLLTVDQVKSAARDVGGIQDFDAKYPSVIVEVKNEAGMGVMLGVKSTPTFFINGRMTGGQDPRVIDALIDLEMKRASTDAARKLP